MVWRIKLFRKNQPNPLSKHQPSFNRWSRGCRIFNPLEWLWSTAVWWWYSQCNLWRVNLWKGSPPYIFSVSIISTWKPERSCLWSSCSRMAMTIRCWTKAQPQLEQLDFELLDDFKGIENNQNLPDRPVDYLLSAICLYTPRLWNIRLHYDLATLIHGCRETVLIHEPSPYIIFSSSLLAILGFALPADFHDLSLKTDYFRVALLKSSTASGFWDSTSCMIFHSAVSLICVSLFL